MIKQRFDWLLPDLLTACKQEPDIDLIYVMVVAVHEVRGFCYAHHHCGVNINRPSRRLLALWVKVSCPLHR